MTIKKTYTKPTIEEHTLDRIVNLQIGSPVGPPFPASASEAPEAPSAASPQIENPSAAEYPFGGDSPDFSNM